MRSDRLESVFAQKVGTFITACRLRERETFMTAKTNRYRFELVVDPAAEREAHFFKKMANDIIFESPQLQQIEHKARRVLFDLWHSCWSNYVEKGSRVINILPPRVGKLIDAEKQRSGRDIRLEVDGGIKVDNIRGVAAAGADTFVAGSAIFGSTDYKATIAAMRAAIKAE